VCWDQPCEVLLTACGHAVLCKQCFERLLGADTAPECPLCKTAVPPSSAAWRLLNEPALDATSDSAAAAPTSDAADEAAALRARVKSGDLAPQRALACAAHMGDDVLLRELVLEHGAEPNMPDVARPSPLDIAAVMGHVRCVRALLDLGADVARVDEDGCTAQASLYSALCNSFCIHLSAPSVAVLSSA
jgi:hypothetical protein